MDETTGSSSGREITEQNIIADGFVIVLIGDFVIYEGTLSSLKKKLKTVKFPEWRQLI